ncbi:MAG: hypothetical protein JO095_13535 [Alphaproteobacteria bacterium]|nr:hypothetical protein [Alphaproteobacteria bacterium]
MRLGLRTAWLVAIAIIGFSAPHAGSAQLYLTKPDMKAGPIEPNDPLVGLPIPGATPAEYRADLIWNFRAGLNVAALQCQFSPFLRTTPNYNAFLADHSEELANAYAALNAYFKRRDGAVRGAKAFDEYSTQTYNNFSTLQAQLGFCQTAADILKSALATPKGQLVNLAQQRMRELRNSLVPVGDPSSAPNNPYAVTLQPIPSMADQCWDKNDRLKPSCAVAGS